MAKLDLKSLSSWGWEFLLPLPLLGLAFWVGTGWASDRLLSNDYPTTEEVQADTEEVVRVSMQVTVINIEAEIHQSENFTEVQVNTVNSALTELRFEFPVTEYRAIETAIAQELGLSIEAVRSLVRYRIDT